MYCSETHVTIWKLKLQTLQNICSVLFFFISVNFGHALLRQYDKIMLGISDVVFYKATFKLPKMTHKIKK